VLPVLEDEGMPIQREKYASAPKTTEAVLAGARWITRQRDID